jgi:membrane protease YdiL (CAAX protease family)
VNPRWFDHTFVLFLTALVPVLGTFAQRRLRRAIAAGVPNAKLGAYRSAVIWQWVFAAIVSVMWATSGRDWRSLGFSSPGDGAGFWLVTIVVVVVSVALALQPGRARHSAAMRERVRKATGSYAAILPTTALEYRGFIRLSCTAGIVEEWVYRGFLLWYFGTYVPLWAAVAASSVVFGVAHAYQSAKGIVRTGGIGALFAILYLMAGSLWPVMVLHAAVDIFQGQLIYTALRDPVPE